MMMYDIILLMSYDDLTVYVNLIIDGRGHDPYTSRSLKYKLYKVIWYCTSRHS